MEETTVLNLKRSWNLLRWKACFLRTREDLHTRYLDSYHIFIGAQQPLEAEGAGNTRQADM